MFYTPLGILCFILLSIISSKYGLIRYHSFIKYVWELDGHDDIVNHIITINHFLPDRHKIYTSETTLFRRFYIDYRGWITDLYIKQFLSSVLSDYHSIFSFRNRKLWNVKALEDVLQGITKEGMFLLETLEYYFSLREEHSLTGKDPLYSCGATPEQNTLTDIGRVAYKIHLAALTARNIAGYHNSTNIEATQQLLN